MDRLVVSKEKFQVKFDDQTGFCTLMNGKKREKEFAGVSQMVCYCKEKDIEIAIEDCIVSNVKNY
ncbi:MAG: hypothetical protein SPK52_01675 [Synergistales bacterium]|nr:hypothetical protein [Bacteroidales bacterium]MDY6394785.1 hypothetical protein [Bacteroidales bacterium]MDY6424265.1 hypothetical protein [Bacteroidales bacterium]MDY6434907.1 hypothetical protein [Synergistales bacterium]